MTTERKDDQGAGLRRTVIFLVVVALAFYLGFMYLGLHR